MTPKTIITYRGENVHVNWDRRLCIHAAECGRAKGDLFQAGRDPWCQPDITQREEVEEVVNRCPTGALSVTTPDGEARVPDPAPENIAQVANDGPLYLTGDLDIDAASDDMPGTKRHVALCRCGASQKKPFCDGSHIKAEFRDYGAVGERGVANAEQGGPLKVTAIEDGPFMVEGNLTIRAGSGRTAWQGRKVFLCRCGASKNKPFCDGSHKEIEFKG
ncbi:MAG: CDGSH iron-sulfur domain-containing protein [bacterium]